MNETLLQSAYFSVVLSLAAYWVGVRLRRRFNHPLVHPLLIATVLVIAFLMVTGIEYETYAGGIAHLSWLLTPTTVCLAIPLYRQLQMLKKHWAALLIGIAAGCLACAVSILVMARLFGLTPEIYHSLQSKSVTTAIALGISEKVGGIAGITSLSVVITGLFGAVACESLCKLLRITHPVARGLAIGSCSHAMGTSRAMELGEVEGAMSSLSIVVAGVMTVVVAPLFSGFIS